MRVIVGLRNPGPDYEGTRHNVGFEVLTRLATDTGARLRRGPVRVRADVAEVRLGGERVVLAAPRRYMNESGGPVAAVLRYFEATPADLLVIHDDIDLAFGRLRLQTGGGSGGHNGVRSLVGVLGTTEFARLKVGVGRPPTRVDPADHVLSRFSAAEAPAIDPLVGDAAEVAALWVSDTVAATERAALRRPEGD